MKKHFYPRNYFLMLICSFVFCLFSCKKESLNTSSLNGNAINNAGTEVKKLVLAPGYSDKASASIEHSSKHPWIDSTPDYPGDTTLSIYAWTDVDKPILGRSFIMFTCLSQIPDTSQVVSATLYLTGITNPNISLPQGDSYYAGSPYTQPNSVVVSAITEKWSAKTLTWNNQPTVTEKASQIIPPSTQQWGYNVAVDVTQIVSAMVAHPTRNYGFQLRCQVEKKYRSMGFYSTQYADSTKRPTLVINYQ